MKDSRKRPRLAKAEFPNRVVTLKQQMTEAIVANGDTDNAVIMHAICGLLGQAIKTVATTTELPVEQTVRASIEAIVQAAGLDGDTVVTCGQPSRVLN